MKIIVALETHCATVLHIAQLHWCYLIVVQIKIVYENLLILQYIRELKIVCFMLKGL